MKKITDLFNSELDELISKIDKSINEFKFNVSIALFYETYKFFNNYISKKIENKNLKNNFIKVMKLMVPFVPHISYECLDLLKCENKDEWPKINKNFQNEVKFAVQVNGKTRDIISITKDSDEKVITKILTKNMKVNKYLKDKKILKTIFVRNKIINYILND